jgi:hypothetical protein
LDNVLKTGSLGQSEAIPKSLSISKSLMLDGDWLLILLLLLLPLLA